MKKLLALGFLFNTLLLTSCDVQGLVTPKASVLVQVTEEDGTPVSAAKVICAASLSTPSSIRLKDGYTGVDGTVPLKVSTIDGLLKGVAEKRGYYATHTDYKSLVSSDPDQLKPFRNGKWEEKLTLPIVIRPIKNPVPMKVKEQQFNMPNPGTWTGYDLEIGDWVSPYGRGQVSDIEFLGTGNRESYKEYESNLHIRFPGQGNGILVYDIPQSLQGCQLKSPYEAPADGYLQDWTWKHTRTTKGRKFSEINDEGLLNRMFIIRVRAETDEWGSVIRAQYGKIYGPVRTLVGNEGEGHAIFTYYLNPDYTRNLEYDPKQNLFPQDPLKGQEYRP